ncbi:MAG: hypothetical protein JRE64_04635 [Deltaproteobacteria bacterium]|nr:hypothetical protein [Deltaproteobacteria bacterium]
MTDDMRGIPNKSRVTSKSTTSGRVPANTGIPAIAASSQKGEALKESGGPSIKAKAKTERLQRLVPPHVRNKKALGKVKNQPGRSLKKLSCSLTDDIRGISGESRGASRISSTPGYAKAKAGKSFKIKAMGAALVQETLEILSKQVDKKQKFLAEKELKVTMRDVDWLRDAGYAVKMQLYWEEPDQELAVAHQKQLTTPQTFFLCWHLEWSRNTDELLRGGVAKIDKLQHLNKKMKKFKTCESKRKNYHSVPKGPPRIFHSLGLALPYSGNLTGTYSPTKVLKVSPREILMQRELTINLSANRKILMICKATQNGDEFLELHNFSISSGAKKYRVDRTVSRKYIQVKDAVPHADFYTKMVGSELINVDIFTGRKKKLNPLEFQIEFYSRTMEGFLTNSTFFYLPAKNQDMPARLIEVFYDDITGDRMVMLWEQQPNRLGYPGAIDQQVKKIMVEDLIQKVKSRM